MFRFITFIIILLVSLVVANGEVVRPVVADSQSKTPLAGASVFDRNGKFVGACDSSGRLPYILKGSYPVSIRHMGYFDQKASVAQTDTIFMEVNELSLPEVVIETPEHKYLHMLAYMREYSTLSTYTDTIFLFREKMVDYMLPHNNNSKFLGWKSPRVLKSRSYYHFTNAEGLDSVGDKCNQHFSWSDWVGIIPASEIPEGLKRSDFATDTVHGKYMPTEIWNRNADRVALNVDILAKRESRKWVPTLSKFFDDNVDFENLIIRYNFSNVAGDFVKPIDLNGYSYNVESRGRGRGMFMFNRKNEPFFVETNAEVYFIDKEYITLKEAKKWNNLAGESADIEIVEPYDLSPPPAPILALIDRVDHLDRDAVRISLDPDYRLVSKYGHLADYSIGHRALAIFKNLLGISSHKEKTKSKEYWRSFHREQNRRNGNN